MEKTRIWNKNKQETDSYSSSI